MTKVGEKQPLLSSHSDSTERQSYGDVLYANAGRQKEAVYTNVNLSGGPMYEKSDGSKTSSLGLSKSGQLTENQIYEPYNGPTGDRGIKQVSTRQRMLSTGEVVEPITLSWQHIDVVAPPENRRFCRGPAPGAVGKAILRDVCGLVKPGTLLAIMGSSGSGKTTLLNVLTYRNTGQLQMTGEVRVNGVEVGRGIRNISAYVQQDDLFIGTLTVREHLTFRALLRMDKMISKEARLQRVEQVITELGLGKCADTLIGWPGRLKGISGGEMRRLGFASEVLTNPPLMFCDEATSGLDSYMAQNIVHTLKNMAAKGRTILCTIHQPSSEVYDMFDQVLVMAEGRVAYMGPANKAMTFFGKHGYDCPVNYNPADFYIMTLAVVPGKKDECMDRVEKLCDAFESSDEATNMRDQVKTTCRSAMTESGSYVIDEALSNNTDRYEASWCRQFATVIWRCWVSNYREPLVIRIRLIQAVFIGVLLGLIYLRQDYNQEGVMNINGVLFLLINNMSFSNMFAVINVFPTEVPIFLREYGSGIYRVDVYYICKMLAELPQFIMLPFVFGAIVYYMVGLYDSVDAFFIFIGILIMVANVALSFGYWISTFSSSISVAMSIAPPLLIPLMLFGGFFLNNGTVPDYFIWLEYLSWFKFSNELLIVNQWEHVTHIDCPIPEVPFQMNSSGLPIPNGTDIGRCFRDGSQVIESLNFSKDNYYLDIGLLFALMAGFRILAFLFLYVRARRSSA